MKAENLLIILMVGLNLLFSQDLEANSSCKNLFDFNQNKILEIIETSEKPLSEIQSLEWLKQKLITEGWAEKIRKSNFETTHVELFSEMLKDTVHILLKDFREDQLGLNTVTGAENFLKIIIEDIENHIKKREVTRKYFFQINYAISYFNIFKNHNPLARFPTYNMTFDLEARPFREAMIQSDFPKLRRILGSIKSEFIKDSGKYIRTQRIIQIPTFFNFKTTSFTELGWEIAPAGLSLNKYNYFDGVVSSASQFFTHDISHNFQINRDAQQLKPNDFKKFKTINTFLTSKLKSLTREEEFLFRYYLFSIVHEGGTLKEYIEIFYNPKKISRSIKAKNSSVFSSESIYDELKKSEEFKINFEENELPKILEEIIKKASIEFKKSQ